MTDRVLLVGMMGAGKTTVGRRLGLRLGWPYYDNDELLHRAVGVRTRELQRKKGEAALRRAESAALSVALTQGPPLVAGVAAGVVTDPMDRQRLRAGGFVVWLRARIETLAARVENTDRPWLGKDPAAALSRLYAGRADLYAAVADMVVDVDVMPVEIVTDRIVAALNR